MKSFASVFGHPELHGPQICAIHMIAKYSDNVDVLFRNVSESHWKFPGNTNMKKDGKLVNQELVYKKNMFVKIFYFARFSFIMLLSLWRNKYDLVVLFDPMAFFSFSLIYPFVPKRFVVWYHNYDSIDLNNTKKYSLGWFAYKAPFRMFPRIDFFTLPMEERVKLFPVHLLKNKYQIIPNYSMLEIHSGKARSVPKNKITLVYVGSIGSGHGLEEIIKLLRFKAGEKELGLVLKGYIQADYKNELLKLAEQYAVKDKLVILPRGPWEEVPEVIRNCHVGIAIYTGKDQMNATLGKGGSGKVYQYIAEGLPVFMNDDFYINFRDCQWAVPTALNQDSILKNIAGIINNYEQLTRSAAESFAKEYNCNIYFDRFFKAIAVN